MGDEAACAKLGSVLIAVVLFAGCGGGSAPPGGPGTGGTTGGTYAAKCEVGCRPSTTTDPICGGQDPAQCTHDCTVFTEGLTNDCATCIAQHIYWASSGSTCLGPSIPDTTGSECVSMCTPMPQG
jgi:hypothetical protein